MTRSITTQISIIILLLAQYIHTQAQQQDSTSHWKKKLALGLNINQAAFSANWKAGGVSSIGLNAQINAKADYKKDRHQWDNELDILYGFVYRENAGYNKTLDRLYLNSQYNYVLPQKKWKVFTSLNLLTQLATGYNNEEPSGLVSSIFTPAFITSAWGVIYQPTDYLQVKVAPIAPRITIVNNPGRFVASVGETPYGVEPSKNVRVEPFAFQLVADFDKDLTENINLKWRYLLFANYQAPSIKQVDHRLDLNLTAKVWTIINVSIGGILLYDYDQDKNVQFNQLFTFGLAYEIKR